MIKQKKEIEDAYNKADFIKNTYSDYNLFLIGVDESLKLLIMMLSSKSSQDTIEAIKVFKLLYQYGIMNARIGIKKMLTLLFSKDDNVRNTVVDVYEQLFFDRSLQPIQKSKNLLELMKNATLTDITCIEELLKQLIKKEAFEKEMFKQLWISYAKEVNVDSLQKQGIKDEDIILIVSEAKLQQRSAIQLIRMIGNCDAQIIHDEKRILMVKSIEFAQYEVPDFIIMKEAINVFEKLILDT